MIKKFTLLLSVLLAVSLQAQDTRYIDPIFEEYEVQENVYYGANVTVIQVPVNGQLVTQPLAMDVYTPKGDEETSRPLIIVLHSGNFLPQFVNGSIVGTKTDPYVVALIEDLVKRGYVVASADYRQGWNPISSSQDVRTSTLINAAYRGVQDLNTCVRYFKKTVAEGGNPFGVDPEKIVTWGIGTGGYVTSSAAGIDKYEDLLLPKFFTQDADGNPIPMTIKSIHGDPEAKELGVAPTGDTLCIPNHVEYSSRFAMSVNQGGAIGDTSWIDKDDTEAFIGFHVPRDPYAPYEAGNVVVPTTGDFVVEAFGSKSIVGLANRHGLNDAFKDIEGDAYTIAALANGGQNGLFPFPRPSYDIDGDGKDDIFESAPWAFWDKEKWEQVQPQQCADQGIPLAQCNWHLVELRDDPSMSLERAAAYRDSMINYFAPRACKVLGLQCGSISTKDPIIASHYLDVYPNPTTGTFNIKASEGRIERIEVYSVSGSKIVSQKVDGHQYTYDGTLPSGMYIIQVKMGKGIAVKKLLVE